MNESSETSTTSQPPKPGDLWGTGHMSPAEEALAAIMLGAQGTEQQADACEAAGLPNAAAFKRATAEEMRRIVRVMS